MGDFEEKAKRSQSRKKNMMMKVRHNQGELRGAFAIKAIDPRKGVYRREKVKVNEIYEDEDD